MKQRFRHQADLTRLRASAPAGQARSALLLLFLLGLAATAAAQQAPAPSLVKENATVKLTDHVWAIPDGNIGGVHVRLFTKGPTPLHTRGDTLIWVEEDRVLLTGDVVMSRRFLAANQTASIRLWLTTLDELAALRPLHVVRAHGDLGNATMIARDQEYLRAVQARVGALKKERKSVDEAVQAVAAEIAPKYPEWGNPNGVAATVRAAYAEAP